MLIKGGGHLYPSHRRSNTINQRRIDCPKLLYYSGLATSAAVCSLFLFSFHAADSPCSRNTSVWTGVAALQKTISPHWKRRAWLFWRDITPPPPSVLHKILPLYEILQIISRAHRDVLDCVEYDTALRVSLDPARISPRRLLEPFAALPHGFLEPLVRIINLASFPLCPMTWRLHPCSCRLRETILLRN